MLRMVPLAFALLCAGAVQTCAAPSFDCKRASSIAEKAICGLSDLEKLDRGIAASFKEALAVLNPADAVALRADQRAWLETRDHCDDLIHGDPPVYADVFGCLRERMTARASRLRAIAARRQFRE